MHSSGRQLASRAPPRSCRVSGAVYSTISPIRPPRSGTSPFTRCIAKKGGKCVHARQPGLAGSVGLETSFSAGEQTRYSRDNRFVSGRLDDVGGANPPFSRRIRGLFVPLCIPPSLTTSRSYRALLDKVRCRTHIATGKHRAPSVSLSIGILPTQLPLTNIDDSRCQVGIGSQ